MSPDSLGSQPFGNAWGETVPKGLRRVKDIDFRVNFHASAMWIPKRGTRIVITIPFSDTYNLRVYGRVTSRRKVRI